MCGSLPAPPCDAKSPALPTPLGCKAAGRQGPTHHATVQAPDGHDAGACLAELPHDEPGHELTVHKSADLCWVHKVDTDDVNPVSPARAICRAVSKKMDAVGVPLDPADVQLPADVRVQVELSSGWHDFKADEAQEALWHLRKGVSSFMMQINGQDYVMDFEGDDGPTQTNQLTGKRRRLRLLDAVPVGRGQAGAQSPSERLRQQQEAYGPQSQRGAASQHPFAKYLGGNLHAQRCFRMLEENEKKLCCQWAAFYHSYSFAALLYEVQAAVANVLFRFRSEKATLPRILCEGFHDIPDARTLIYKFDSEFVDQHRDHNPGFRKVGISAMCSLMSTGPEVCVAKVFNAGYSCKDMSFQDVLKNLLKSLYVPRYKVGRVASKIIKLAEQHGLDASQFGGRACASGKAGHLLQVFVRRDLVDRLAYAARPYGPVDEARMPLSAWMDGDQPFSDGQARLLAHPKYFMDEECVRLHVVSADPTFHRTRRAFQQKLVQLIWDLSEPTLRQRAAAGIYGGTLPSWWAVQEDRPWDRKEVPAGHRVAKASPHHCGREAGCYAFTGRLVGV